MKLEQQVVSLELAKQLKELGVKQDSLFYWFNMEREKDYYDDAIGWHYNKVGWHVVGKDEIERYKNDREIDNSEFTPISHYRSAFTVAELGEMLPKSIYGFNPVISLLEDEVQIGYADLQGNVVKVLNDIHLKAETEADARAKMLIWLIENKYLDLERTK